MARRARFHVLAVAILVVGAAAQAAFEAALASDEHCRAGAGGPCALSALQLRGRAVSGEGGRSGCGRRRCAGRRKRSYHIGRKDLPGFKEVLQRSLALRRSVKKKLDALERTVSQTYKMVDPDQQAALHDRKRRRDLVPRAAAVKDCYDRLQHILDAERRRQARCSRLDHWTRTRLEDPSTPPFKQMQLQPEDGGFAEARPEALVGEAVGEGGGDEVPKESRAQGGSGGLVIELELEIEVEGKVEIDLELELELELRLCNEEEEDGEDGGQATSSEALERPEVHAPDGKATGAHMKDELEEEFRELAAVVDATAKHAADTRRLVVQTLNFTATA